MNDWLSSLISDLAQAYETKPAIEAEEKAFRRGAIVSLLKFLGLSPFLKGDNE